METDNRFFFPVSQSVQLCDAIETTPLGRYVSIENQKKAGPVEVLPMLPGMFLTLESSPYCHEDGKAWSKKKDSAGDGDYVE